MNKVCFKMFGRFTKKFKVVRKRGKPYGARRALKMGPSRPAQTRYKVRPMKSAFARNVMKVVNTSAETKEVMLQIANNVPVLHNSVLNINNNAFLCDIGVHGQNHNSGSTKIQRIGNKCFVKGIKVSLHIEAQQYRPDTQYMLYLIRNKFNPAGILDTKAEIFEGVSDTIPLDYIDTDKVDIIYSKKFKVKMANMGSTRLAGPAGVFDTSAVVITDPLAPYEGIDTIVTNPRWMGKFYVPINKTIMYGDSDDAVLRQIPASYRYQWVLTGYDNFSTTTGTTTWPLAHVSMTTVMKFTDV